MIVKIMKPTPTFFTPLEYNEKKAMSGVAEVKAVRNINSTKYHDIYTTLRERESLSLNTKKPSFHAVFNEADFDNVEYEEQMLAIIDQTMEDIGMAEQPYAVYRHVDIDRKHYHVVSTKILPDGRSVLWNGIGKRATHSLEIHQEESCYLAGKSMEAILKEWEGESVYRNALEAFETTLNTATYKSRDEFVALLASHKISVDFTASKYAQNDMAILRHTDRKCRPVYVPCEMVALLDEKILANHQGLTTKRLRDDDLRISRLYAYAAYIKNNSLAEMMKYGEHIKTLVYRNKRNNPVGVGFAIAALNRVVKSSEIDADLSKALRENDFSDGTKELFRKKYWEVRNSLLPQGQQQKNDKNRNEEKRTETQQKEFKILSTVASTATPVENQKKIKKKTAKKKFLRR